MIAYSSAWQRVQDFLSAYDMFLSFFRYDAGSIQVSWNFSPYSRGRHVYSQVHSCILDSTFSTGVYIGVCMVRQSISSKQPDTHDSHPCHRPFETMMQCCESDEYASIGWFSLCLHTEIGNQGLVCLYRTDTIAMTEKAFTARAHRYACLCIPNLAIGTYHARNRPGDMPCFCGAFRPLFPGSQRLQPPRKNNNNYTDTPADPHQPPPTPTPPHQKREKQLTRKQTKTTQPDPDPACGSSGLLQPLLGLLLLGQLLLRVLSAEALHENLRTRTGTRSCGQSALSAFLGMPEKHEKGTSGFSLLPSYGHGSKSKSYPQ